MDKNETLIAAAVQNRLGDQLLAAFRRVKDELDIGTDALLAERLGYPATYNHWLHKRRPWPMEEACKLAALAGCHLDELLRLPGVKKDQNQGGPGRRATLSLPEALLECAELLVGMVELVGGATNRESGFMTKHVAARAAGLAVDCRAAASDELAIEEARRRVAEGASDA